MLGIPMIEIRKILRRNIYYIADEEYITKTLKISKRKAHEIIKMLIKSNYLNHDAELPHKRYTNTIKGNALACATAALPIKRSTADQKVKEFLERVKTVNSDECFHYQITRIDIFGSYLSKKERISDIDLIVYLELKNEKDRSLPDYDYSHGIDPSGKVLVNYMGEELFMDTDTYKYLKNRKRSISIHTPADELYDIIIYKTIYKL